MSGSHFRRICPQHLFSGGCPIPNCGLQHSWVFCEICSITHQTTDKTHIKSKGHRQLQAASTNGVRVRCSICDVRLSGEGTWIEHVGSPAHLARAREAGKSPQVYPSSATQLNANYCLICKRSIPGPDWQAHLGSRVHSQRQLSSLFKAQFEQAETDRRGVSVSAEAQGVDFGIEGVEESKRGRKVQVTVSAEKSGLSITKVTAYEGKSNTPSVSMFSASTAHLNGVLTIGQTIPITVAFRHTHRGRFEGRLEIAFKDAISSRTFGVIRRLRAVVGNAQDHELLKPTAPYVKNKRVKWRAPKSASEAEFMEGQRPPGIDAVPWVRMLPKARIPKELAELLCKGSTSEAVEAIMNSKFFPEAMIDLESHTRRFSCMLWVEEARIVEDLRMYDMHEARFTKEGRLYTLTVPGLAEKRPSVVVGDHILAQRAGSDDNRAYRGFVHEVRREDIRVSFHPSFASSKAYNIMFQYNRTPVRRQHQGLQAPTTLAQALLLPELGNEGLAQATHPSQFPVSLYDARITSNAAQLQAVKSALNLQAGSAPFVLFGPPGTGKTTTDVEIIRQILSRNPEAKILACAPSNSAADRIAELLSVALNPQEMFRCNAVFRLQGTLSPAALIDYCCIRDNHFALPPLQVLESYKVIVSTCGNASFPFNIGMKIGHFTHILVDEAGQASEPEVLCAIKAIVGPSTRTILSGDPKQLGPVIRSSIARELGLGKSYLERLMERPVYNDQTGRGRSFVKLVKNFRSHKAILQYPNERFYDSELEVHGDPKAINAFIGSSQLVNRKFPVVFQHVSGENEQESTSPSYFNILEATEVVERINQLLADRAHPVRTEDIAVITPYYAQTRKIRLLLKQSGIEGVTVCSVELIQGQERPVIILSTVRSSQDLLSYDAKFTLGFVANPRRFNVAVTRAKGLLIVIGDSSVLSIDPLWRGFMNYVHSNGGWSGDAPGWDTTLPVQMDVDHAAEMREAAAVEMEALVARFAESEDIEGGANLNLPFVELE